MNGVDTAAAGFRLIPLLIALPVAGILASIFVSNLRVSPFYVLVLSGILQVLGLALMCSESSVKMGNLSAVEVLSELIIGFGFGFNSSTLLLFIPLVLDDDVKGKTHSNMKFEIAPANVF